MITIRAVVLGKDIQHAFFIAKQIKSVNNGQLTTLVDGNRVYCSLQCNDPKLEIEEMEESVLAKNILAEISIRDMFEENLIDLGCPFTFINECDTDDGLSLEDMKTCDGSDELLTQLFELESLRNILSMQHKTFKYAVAIDSLLPYIKKSLFSKGDNNKK